MSSGLWNASLHAAEGWRAAWARFVAIRRLGGAGAMAAAVCAASLLAACNNSPYPAGAAKDNTLYLSFDERSPRYLDPTASYTAPESVYTYQITEPLYGYHYLKRPYELIPKAAVEVTRPHYVDKDGKPLPDDAPADAIAESIYDVRIKPGILYAPHPAFAKDGQGKYRYLNLTREQLGSKRARQELECSLGRAVRSPAGIRGGRGVARDVHDQAAAQ